MATATGRRVANPATGQSPARTSLADTIQGSRKLPSRIVLHGQGGVGKTSFAAFAPKPLFLLSPGETGIHVLMDAGLIPETPNLEVSDWLSALAIIEELTTTEHQYKTLVIDVIDGLEKLCNAHVCQTDYNGDWSEKGFMGFQRGFRAAAAGPWRGLLAAIDRLRDTKRMGILLLAHTGVGNFQNPTGPDFHRYAPDMYKDAWQLTFGWADMVLFAHREVVAAKEKGDSKAKGKGAMPRVFITEWSPVADAKNRHNLPEEIEMGNSGREAWDNFSEAVKAARKAGGNG